MLYPVILAGGSNAPFLSTDRGAGKDQAPAKNAFSAKRFSAGDQGHSLFQTSLARFSGTGFAPVQVMASAETRFFARQQIDALGLAYSKIIVAPQSDTNTASVLTAALSLQEFPDAIMVISALRPQVADNAAFFQALKTAKTKAMEGEIVVLGVTPDHPSTALGYLKVMDETDPNASSQPVAAFQDHADTVDAMIKFASGAWLWNSGTLVARVDTLLRAFETHAPDLIQPCKSALCLGFEDCRDFILDPHFHAGCHMLPLSDTILQPAENCSVVLMEGNHKGIENWLAARGRGTGAQDPAQTELRTEIAECDKEAEKAKYHRDLELERLCLELAEDTNETVFSFDGTVLASPLHSEDRNPTRYHRPWGFYETLSEGDGYEVSRFVIKPGGRFSLQGGIYQAEFWAVLEGRTTMTSLAEMRTLEAGEAFQVSVGDSLSLENQSAKPIQLINIQTGGYQGMSTFPSSATLDPLAKVMAS